MFQRHQDKAHGQLWIVRYICLFVLGANDRGNITRRLYNWISYLMFLEALMISLMRGTPRVIFIDATPAKWKVFSVIWVPGSPMLWAQRAPTADPGSIWALSRNEKKIILQDGVSKPNQLSSNWQVKLELHLNYCHFNSSQKRWMIIWETKSTT